MLTLTAQHDTITLTLSACADSAPVTAILTPPHGAAVSLTVDATTGEDGLIHVELSGWPWPLPAEPSTVTVCSGCGCYMAPIVAAQSVEVSGEDQAEGICLARDLTGCVRPEEAVTMPVTQAGTVTVIQPAQGSVVVNGTTLTYTAPAFPTGTTELFVSFAYTITSPGGGESSAMVYVHVTADCPLCPPESFCTPAWEPAPATRWRCTGPFMERRQRDGCGNYRWSATGTAVTWTATGRSRCQEASGYEEIEEANPCGERRWTLTQTLCGSNCTPDWHDDAGVRQCVGEAVMQRQSDGCGGIRWRATGETATYALTGVARCRNGTQEVQQTSSCGDEVWLPTEQACGCAPEWVYIPAQRRCNAGGNNRVETLQHDGCGNERWMVGFGDQLTDSVNGVYAFADTWLLSGNVRCDAGTGKLEKEWVTWCGQSQYVATSIDCGACTPAAPVAVLPYTYDCSDLPMSIKVKMHDGCGTFSWASTPLDLAYTGNERCNGAGSIEQEAYSEKCGVMTWVDTYVPCLGQCLTTWLDLPGDVYCDAWDEYATPLFVYQRQRDSCDISHTRGKRIARYQSLTPTGRTECTGGNVWVEYANPCGDTTMEDSGVPCGSACVPTWRDVPGSIRCMPAVFGYIEQEQSDGCGGTRWMLLRGYSWNWANVRADGAAECHNGTLQYHQYNACGDEQWVDTGTPC